MFIILVCCKKGSRANRLTPEGLHFNGAMPLRELLLNMQVAFSPHPAWRIVEFVATF